MRQLEQEINLLLEKESKMWSQRSRIRWLKDGEILSFIMARQLSDEEEIT